MSHALIDLGTKIVAEKNLDTFWLGLDIVSKLDVTKITPSKTIFSNKTNFSGSLCQMVHDHVHKRGEKMMCTYVNDCLLNKYRLLFQF